MDNNEIKQQIHDIMAQFIQQASGWDDDIDDTMSLINGGLIDSLTMVNVVVALQKSFKIEIAVTEISIDNFDTLAAIYDFVCAKKSIA